MLEAAGSRRKLDLSKLMGKYARTTALENYY
jgi:hypothetical protein